MKSPKQWQSFNSVLMMLLVLIGCGRHSNNGDGAVKTGEILDTKSSFIKPQNESFNLLGEITASGNISVRYAALFGEKGPEGCTVTRVGERHFLTAGHCLFNEDDSFFNIILNTGGRWSFERHKGSVVSQYTRKFGSTTNFKDIAITTVFPTGTDKDVLFNSGAFLTGVAQIETLDPQQITALSSLPQEGAPARSLGYGNYFASLTPPYFYRDDYPQGSGYKNVIPNPTFRQELNVDLWENWTFGIDTICGIGGIISEFYHRVGDYNASNGDSGGPVFTGSSLVALNSRWSAKSLATNDLEAEAASSGMVCDGYRFSKTQPFTNDQVIEIKTTIEVPIVDGFVGTSLSYDPSIPLELKPGDTFELHGYDLDDGIVKFNDQNIGVPPLSNGVIANPLTPRTKKFSVTIPAGVIPSLLGIELSLSVEKTSTNTGKILLSESSDRKLKILGPEMTALARVKSGNRGGAMSTLASLVGSSPTGSVNVERGESILIAGKWMFSGLAPQVRLPTIDPSILGVFQITQGVPQSLLDQGYEVWEVQIPSTFLTGKNSSVEIVGSNPLLKSGQIVRIVGLKDWELMVSYERLNQGGELLYPDGGAITCPSTYYQPQDYCIIEVKTLEKLSSGLMTHNMKIAAAANHTPPPTSQTVCSNLGNVPAETCLKQEISMKESFNVGSHSMGYSWEIHETDTDTWYMATYDSDWIFLKYEKQTAVRTWDVNWRKSYTYSAVQTQREQAISGNCKLSTVIDSYFSGSGTQTAVGGNHPGHQIVSGFSLAPMNVSLNEISPEQVCISGPDPNDERLNGEADKFVRASPNFVDAP